MPRGLITFSSFAAAGLSGLLALAALNLAADKLNMPGLTTLRAYITRSAQ